MDKKTKPENLRSLSDEELLQILQVQDTLFANFTHEQQEQYKIDHGRYTLTKGSASLGYFGAKHIFEPENQQFASIHNDFTKFLEGKDRTRVVVLVEGSIPNTSQDMDRDIHKTGERGFIAHIAKDMEIKVDCIEPDRIAEVKYLLKYFEPGEIEYYYYLRGIRNYFRPGLIEDGTTFEEYSAQILNHHKKLFDSLTEFTEFDFTLEHMKEIHNKITGSEFDVNNRIDINPRKQDTVIGQISHASSSYRDFYHVRKIEQELNSGYAVFVVNGNEHALVQRPALEKMFSE